MQTFAIAGQKITTHIRCRSHAVGVPNPPCGRERFELSRAEAVTIIFAVFYGTTSKPSNPSHVFISVESEVLLITPGEFMHIKLTMLVAVVLLCVSGSARGDSLKSKPETKAIHFTAASHDSDDDADVKSVSTQFKTTEHNNKHVLHFGENKAVKVVSLGATSTSPATGDGDGDSDDPATTPEPASIVLLAIGLVGVGLFVVRRNVSLV